MLCWCIACSKEICNKQGLAFPKICGVLFSRTPRKLHLRRSPFRWHGILHAYIGRELGSSNAPAARYAVLSSRPFLCPDSAHRKPLRGFTMSQALCFNEVQFDVIPQNSQPWDTVKQTASMTSTRATPTSSPQQ